MLSFGAFINDKDLGKYMRKKMKALKPLFDCARIAPKIIYERPQFSLRKCLIRSTPYSKVSVFIRHRAIGSLFMTERLLDDKFFSKVLLRDLYSIHNLF